MEKFKLDIIIEDCENSNVYMIHSKAMKCCFPVSKNKTKLAAVLIELVEEYKELNEYQHA